MKATFRQRLLNGPFGDPSLFIRIAREKTAILFDLGDTRCLSFSEMNKVGDVFVTHTHIDHFIGFEALLRTILRRETPLNIYGPAAIIRNIEGKLRGYTWNLVRDYPARINVVAFDGKTVTRARFSAAEGFRKKIIDKKPSEGLLLDTPLFTVSALQLSHGTPCLAYRLSGKPQINIDKEMLLKKGLAVGPWLTDFKNTLRAGRTDGILSIDGRNWAIGQLTDIVRTGRGPILSYATDIAMTRKNLHSLVSFVRGSDIFYCEAYFLDKDRHLALKRFHLTAAECGKIATAAEVKKLALMHFSPRYEDSPQLLIEEAAKEFGGDVICTPFQQLRQSASQGQSF